MLLRNFTTLSGVLYLMLLAPVAGAGHASLGCVHIAEPVAIDGVVDDQAWRASRPISIEDAVADLSHQVACLYDDKRIYLSIRFPDDTENREHKTRRWDDDQQRFRITNKREDTLVLKWNMDSSEGDLSLSADAPYRADIWYWKAYRSDSQGFADDKYHLYTNEPVKQAKKLVSKSGRRFYLSRHGDQGESTYKVKIGDTDNLIEQGEIEGYELQQPEGSRADIQARGVWSEGYWTIELSRRLQTGHADDIQLLPGNSYQLGVSRYEIAGVRVNDSLQIPQFGAGDIRDTLLLSFIGNRLVEQ